NPGAQNLSNLLNGRLQGPRTEAADELHSDHIEKVRNRFDKMKEPITTCPKKDVFLRIPFKGNNVTAQVKESIGKELERCYPAAELKVLPRTTRLFFSSLKDKHPDPKHVVYKFDCSCAATYIGMTIQCLSERAKEHMPAWLINNNPRLLQKNAESAVAIAKHLIQTQHVVERSAAFKPGSSFLYMPALEALLILRRKPELHIQKEAKDKLLLPWRVL
ncbi:hypothetical protein Ciccas_012661, partial [Cichlidogyrus casuarinus]